MHKDDAALVSHLLAVAMAKLEDGTIIASRGQAPKASRAAITRDAGKLDVIAQDLAAIAGTILAVAHPVDTRMPSRSKKTR